MKTFYSINDKIKKSLALLALVLLPLSVSLQAQQTMVLTPLTANTVSNIVAAPVIVDTIQLLNATTNNATLYFFDAATAITNYVQAAYTSYTTYTTNYNVVWTNQNAVLVTNTFNGLYTAPVANSAATNTRPALLTVVVPANTVLNKDVKIQTVLGLTAVGNQNLTLITTYRAP